MPRYGFGQRTSGQQILAAHDRADDDSLAREKFEYQKTRDSAGDADAQERFKSSAAFKEAELTMKAEAAGQRAANFEQIGSIREEQLKLQQLSSQLAERQYQKQMAEQELRLKEQIAKEDTATRVMQQGNSWMDASRGVIPGTDEFDSLVRNMGNELPEAIKHPAVAGWMDYNLGEHKRIRGERTKPPDYGSSTVTVGEDGTTKTSTTRPLTGPAVESIALPPEIAGSTGYFLHNGSMKFGFKDVPAEKSPAATPAQIERFKKYQDAHAEAQRAIAAGANADAVKKRLQSMGGDPSKL